MRQAGSACQPCEPVAPFRADVNRRVVVSPWGFPAPKLYRSAAAPRHRVIRLRGRARRDKGKNLATPLPPSQSQKAMPAAMVARKASIPRPRDLRNATASHTRAGAATAPGKIFKRTPMPAMTPPRAFRPLNQESADANATAMGPGRKDPSGAGRDWRRRPCTRRAATGRGRLPPPATWRATRKTASGIEQQELHAERDLVSCPARHEQAGDQEEQEPQDRVFNEIIPVRNLPIYGPGGIIKKNLHHPGHAIRSENSEENPERVRDEGDQALNAGGGRGNRDDFLLLGHRSDHGTSFEQYELANRV